MERCQKGNKGVSAGARKAGRGVGEASNVEPHFRSHTRRDGIRNPGREQPGREAGLGRFGLAQRTESEYNGRKTLAGGNEEEESEFWVGCERM